MGEVIVRNRAGQIRGKGVCQAASHESDILIAINRKSYARSRGSNIGGLGERIVEVELNSVAELLPQARLQGVVVRTADGAPSIHGKSLVVEEFAGTAVESSRAVEEV